MPQNRDPDLSADARKRKSSASTPSQIATDRGQKQRRFSTPPINDDPLLSQQSEIETSQDEEDHSCILNTDNTSARDIFEEAYNRLSDTRKWKLRKRTVEDIIYEQAKGKTDIQLYQFLPASGILDPDAPYFSSLFKSAKDRKMITAIVGPIGELSPKVDESFDQFDVDSEQELLQVMAKDLSESGDGVMDSHTKLWLHQALGRWLNIRKTKLFQRAGTSERWWVDNLWSFVFDAILQNISGAILVR